MNLRGIPAAVLAGLAVFAVTGALVVGAVTSVVGGTDRTPAERMALRVDAVLDRMEEPEFSAFDLHPYWAFEIAPFFQYENLTQNEYFPPMVIFEAQLAGRDHNHLLGYTYCDTEVFLNIRVINEVSAWYGWARNPLATLVHEMVHTLGGDFCGPDSEITESSTQTATLEVLAALANGGNKVALYSLLLELRDMAEDVVLAQAIEDDDLDSYREFREKINPSALDESRFEKSMRFWANDMDYLKEILNKYSVKVFENVQEGQMELYLPGGDIRAEGIDTLLLDDLLYVLENLEEMADASAPPVSA